jgi:hypothetical protein
LALKKGLTDRTEVVFEDVPYGGTREQPTNSTIKPWRAMENSAKILTGLDNNMHHWVDDVDEILNEFA